MNRLEKALLCLLLVFIPSQLSFRFWPETPLHNLVRIDYLSIPVYFSDLLAASLLVVTIISRSKSFRDLLFSVKNTVQKIILNRPPLVWATVILGVANILVSRVPLLTLYKIVVMGMYSSIFMIYLTKNNAQKIIFTSISASLMWISLLGIGQFAASKSIGGFFWWLGERPLAINSGSIATINIDQFGYRFIRAYSVFPHPNALAGYLVVSLIVLVSVRQKIYPPVLIVSLFCLVTTFSFSGLTAAAVFSALYYFVIYKSRPPRIKFLEISTPAVILGAATHFVLRKSSFFDRLLLMKQSLQMIINYPIFGTGFGAYLAGLNSEIVSSVSFFQPVHNMYLLLSAELGVPLSFLIYFIAFKQIGKDVLNLNVYPFLAVLLLGLFDHYWLTSHANTILLVLTYFLIRRQKSYTNVSDNSAK